MTKKAKTLQEKETPKSGKLNLFQQWQIWASTRLSLRQRQLIAGVFSVLIIGLVVFGYNWLTNSTFRDNILGKNQSVASKSTDNSFKESVDKLNQTLTQVNPEDLIYQTISFEDFPVYPKAWSDRYFSTSEQANSLISGPSADPDGDGLSNKQEYLYGSNPKNKDTLCDGKIDNNQCTGKNDKQLIDSNISPLTGLPLDVPKKIRLKRQDYSVLGSVQDSFEVASKEGVDFPTLYQLSKTIDLTGEYNKIDIFKVEDNRDTFIAYNKARVSILEDFTNEDEISSFTKIYQLSSASDFGQVLDSYNKRLDSLNKTQVPSRYVDSHKAYILLFKKLISLTESRKQGIENKTTASEDYKKQSKQKAIEVVWAFRKLNDELAKLPNQN